MAGIGAGLFTEQELKFKRVSDKIYNPVMSEAEASLAVDKWHCAVDAVRYFAKFEKR